MNALSAPSPAGIPLLGVLQHLRSDPLKYLTEWAKLGDVVELSVPTTRLYLINNPHYAQQVLATTEREFHKGIADRPNPLQEKLLGNGLIAQQGEEWLWARRGLLPPFHRKYVATYTPLMVEHTTRMLKSWLSGDIRDITNDMTQLTLRIICDAFFGFEPPEEIEQIGKYVHLLATEYAKRTLNPLHLPLPFPTIANLRIRHALSWLRHMVSSIIRQRQKSTYIHNDLLTMLINLKDKDGNPISEKQISDHVMTFFLAGYETTSLALSYTFALLSQHPEVEARLVAEVQQVLAGRLPTAEDVQNLPYAQMVLKEAMRLYPPAWIVSARIPQDDYELGGYSIPAGSLLLISQWILHRDGRYYDEPERFYPERWGTEKDDRNSVYPYFPFGAGPRICIGKDFAWLEAILLLVTILQRFRLTLLPDPPIVPLPLATLRPKYGIKMMIHSRPNNGVSLATIADAFHASNGHVPATMENPQNMLQCPYPHHAG